MDEHLQAGREFTLHRLQDLFGSGYHAADAAKELYRPAAFQREANVVNHLADAHLGYQEALRLGSKLSDGLDREGVQRERAEQTHPVPAMACLIHHRL